MGVQRSNYLQVDNELMANLHENPAKVRAMTQNKVAQRKDRNGRQFDLSKHLYNQVYIKYCRPQEVLEKRRAFIQFKASFLSKIFDMYGIDMYDPMVTDEDENLTVFDNFVTF